MKFRPSAHQSYLMKNGIIPLCRREGEILYTIRGFYRLRRRVGYEGGEHTRFLCCSLHYHHLPFCCCFFFLLLNTEHLKVFKTNSGLRKNPRTFSYKYGLLTKLVRSRWLDIGQVLFCVFMDRDEVEVHKHAKKNEANIQPP